MLTLFLLFPLHLNSPAIATPANEQGPDSSTEPPSKQLVIDGLEHPVEILRDAWGVSHIYAETERDLFFAQGYNAAMDRLFQLEIWRRQATGTMAELLGERMIEHDIGARLLRFRGDMQQEMRHYHDRGDRIIPAFVEGINARIAEVRDNPELLPIEFRLLDFKPEPWTPEVVISRHQGLVGNVRQELNLARALHRTGSEKLRELIWFHPDDPVLELDDAIDGELLFDDILRLYNASRTQVRFLPEDVVSEYRANASADDTEGSASSATASGASLFDDTDRYLSAGANPETHGELSEPTDAGSLVLGEDYDIGSNNWVVTGSLSESGYPIMANDPHRVLQAPALRYFVRLNGPGWNVAGGGEPALPGISIGHNGFGAWGLTIFRLDSEDLYVYETHPDDPDSYRYGDGWERMKSERTVIEVRGGEPVTATLRYTRHGPVIHAQPESNTAYALRLGWLEIGNAPYLASLRMNQAQSWEEFRRACEYNNLPGENMVWADRDGNIGWQAAGIAPLRPNWDGLLPVPGDGRYEWDGYLPVRDLPNDHNPDTGFLVTANENLIDDKYEHRRAIGWTWADPYRGNRVREVLQKRMRFNLQQMADLQNDVLSIPARTAVPMLCGLDHPDERVRIAIERLRSWDYRLNRESVAAGIYVEWERQFRQRLSRLLVPEEASGLIGQLQIKPTLDLLLSPDGRFGENPTRGRDRLLLESLEEAVDLMERRLGEDMEHWQYGQPDYKHVHMSHPLSDVVSDEVREQIEVGPAPRDGYSFTVKNTGYGNNQTSGGTFRIIVDTGDFDRTIASNAPGQAGDPDSAYYSHLFDDWVGDRYFPLFYSREKVESVTREVIRLSPR